MDLPLLVSCLRSRMDPSDTSHDAAYAGSVMACFVCRLHDAGHHDVELVCHFSTPQATPLGRIPIYSNAWAVRQGPVVAGWFGERDPKELTETAHRLLQEIVGPTNGPFDDGVICGANALIVHVPLAPAAKAKSMAVVDAVLIDQAVSAHNRPRSPQRM